MIETAGFKDLAGKLDKKSVLKAMPEVEKLARDKFKNSIQLVKHNRGDFIFEAGNIRFGLELRTLGDDGGLAIHVLTDLSAVLAMNIQKKQKFWLLIVLDCNRITITGPAIKFALLLG